MRAILASLVLLTACGELPCPPDAGAEPDAGLDAGSENNKAQGPTEKPQPDAGVDAGLPEDAGTPTPTCEGLPDVSAQLGQPTTCISDSYRVVYMWPTVGGYVCAWASECLAVTPCTLPAGSVYCSP